MPKLSFRDYVLVLTALKVYRDHAGWRLNETSEVQSLIDRVMATFEEQYRDEEAA